MQLLLHCPVKAPDTCPPPSSPYSHSIRRREATTEYLPMCKSCTAGTHYESPSHGLFPKPLANLRSRQLAHSIVLYARLISQHQVPGIPHVLSTWLTTIVSRLQLILKCLYTLTRFSRRFPQSNHKTERNVKMFKGQQRKTRA